MTTIEIQAKQKELLKEINNDEALLESALKYVREQKKLKQLPCQYSVKELKERLKQSREALAKGNYKTQAQMRSKYSLWTG